MVKTMVIKRNEERFLDEALEHWLHRGYKLLWRGREEGQQRPVYWAQLELPEEKKL